MSKPGSYAVEDQKSASTPGSYAVKVPAASTTISCAQGAGRSFQDQVAGAAAYNSPDDYEEEEIHTSSWWSLLGMTNATEAEDKALDTGVPSAGPGDVVPGIGTLAADAVAAALPLPSDVDEAYLELEVLLFKYIVTQTRDVSLFSESDVNGDRMRGWLLDRLRFCRYHNYVSVSQQLLALLLVATRCCATVPRRTHCRLREHIGGKPPMLVAIGVNEFGKVVYFKGSDVIQGYPMEAIEQDDSLSYLILFEELREAVACHRLVPFVEMAIVADEFMSVRQQPSDAQQGNFTMQFAWTGALATFIAQLAYSRPGDYSPLQCAAYRHRLDAATLLSVGAALPALKDNPEQLSLFHFLEKSLSPAPLAKALGQIALAASPDRVASCEVLRGTEVDSCLQLIFSCISSLEVARGRAATDDVRYAVDEASRSIRRCLIELVPHLGMDCAVVCERLLRVCGPQQQRYTFWSACEALALLASAATSAEAPTWTLDRHMDGLPLVTSTDSLLRLAITEQQYKISAGHDLVSYACLPHAYHTLVRRAVQRLMRYPLYSSPSDSQHDSSRGMAALSASLPLLSEHSLEIPLLFNEATRTLCDTLVKHAHQREDIPPQLDLAPLLAEHGSRSSVTQVERDQLLQIAHQLLGEAKNFANCTHAVLLSYPHHLATKLVAALNAFGRHAETNCDPRRYIEQLGSPADRIERLLRIVASVRSRVDRPDISKFLDSVGERREWTYTMLVHLKRAAVGYLFQYQVPREADRLQQELQGRAKTIDLLAHPYVRALESMLPDSLLQRLLDREIAIARDDFDVAEPYATAFYRAYSKLLALSDSTGSSSMLVSDFVAVLRAWGSASNLQGLVHEVHAFRRAIQGEIMASPPTGSEDTTVQRTLSGRERDDGTEHEARELMRRVVAVQNMVAMSTNIAHVRRGFQELGLLPYSHSELAVDGTLRETDALDVVLSKNNLIALHDLGNYRLEQVQGMAHDSRNMHTLRLLTIFADPLVVALMRFVSGVAENLQRRIAMLRDNFLSNQVDFTRLTSMDSLRQLTEPLVRAMRTAPINAHGLQQLWDTFAEGVPRDDSQASAHVEMVHALVQRCAQEREHIEHMLRHVDKTFRIETAAAILTSGRIQFNPTNVPLYSVHYVVGSGGTLSGELSADKLNGMRRLLHVFVRQEDGAGPNETIIGAAAEDGLQPTPNQLVERLGTLCDRLNTLASLLACLHTAGHPDALAGVGIDGALDVADLLRDDTLLRIKEQDIKAWQSAYTAQVCEGAPQISLLSPAELSRAVRLAAEVRMCVADDGAFNADSLADADSLSTRAAALLLPYLRICASLLENLPILEVSAVIRCLTGPLGVNLERGSLVGERLAALGRCVRFLLPLPEPNPYDEDDDFSARLHNAFDMATGEPWSELDLHFYLQQLMQTEGRLLRPAQTFDCQAGNVSPPQMLAVLARAVHFTLPLVIVAPEKLPVPAGRLLARVLHRWRDSRIAGGDRDSQERRAVDPVQNAADRLAHQRPRAEVHLVFRSATNRVAFQGVADEDETAAERLSHQQRSEVLFRFQSAPQLLPGTKLDLRVFIGAHGTGKSTACTQDASHVVCLTVGEHSDVGDIIDCFHRGMVKLGADVAISSEHNPEFDRVRVHVDVKGTAPVGLLQTVFSDLLFSGLIRDRVGGRSIMLTGARKFEFYLELGTCAVDDNELTCRSGTPDEPIGLAFSTLFEGGSVAGEEARSRSHTPTATDNFAAARHSYMIRTGEEAVVSASGRPADSFVLHGLEGFRCPILALAAAAGRWSLTNYPDVSRPNLAKIARWAWMLEGVHGHVLASVPLPTTALMNTPGEFQRRIVQPLKETYLPRLTAEVPTAELQRALEHFATDVAPYILSHRGGGPRLSLHVLNTFYHHLQVRLKYMESLLTPLLLHSPVVSSVDTPTTVGELWHGMAHEAAAMCAKTEPDLNEEVAVYFRFQFPGLSQLDLIKRTLLQTSADAKCVHRDLQQVLDINESDFLGTPHESLAKIIHRLQMTVTPEVVKVVGLIFSNMHNRVTDAVDPHEATAPAGADATAAEAATAADDEEGDISDANSLDIDDTEEEEEEDNDSENEEAYAADGDDPDGLHGAEAAASDEEDDDIDDEDDEDGYIDDEDYNDADDYNDLSAADLSGVPSNCDLMDSTAALSASIHMRHQGLIMCGDTGTGKTENMRLLAALLNFRLQVDRLPAVHAALWQLCRNTRLQQLLDMSKAQLREQLELNPEPPAIVDELFPGIKRLLSLDATRDATVDGGKTVFGLVSSRLIAVMRREMQSNEAIGVAAEDEPSLARLCDTRFQQSAFWQLGVDGGEDHDHRMDTIVAPTVTRLLDILTAFARTLRRCMHHTILMNKNMSGHDFRQAVQRCARAAISAAQWSLRHGHTVAVSYLVFVDEINTCGPCMGLLQEVLVDHRLDGQRLPAGLYFVGAMNPFGQQFDRHRYYNFSGRRNQQLRSHSAFVVRPLPLALDELVVTMRAQVRAVPEDKVPDWPRTPATLLDRLMQLRESREVVIDDEIFDLVLQEYGDNRRGQLTDDDMEILAGMVGWTGKNIFYFIIIFYLCICVFVWERGKAA